MRRSLPYLIGLAAIAAALLVWRCRGDSATDRAATTTTATTTSANGAATKRVDPRQQKRGSIAGAVRDAAKAPIAGATVCAYFAGDEVPDAVQLRWFCAATDATGAYRLTDLFATSYRLHAGARAYRARAWKAAGDIDVVAVPAGAHREGIDFELAAGGVEVRGTVSDIGGGPIAGARVSSDGPHVETDERGAFVLWTAPGSVSISAGADGYLRASKDCSAPCRLELQLIPSGSIAGTVVDGQTGAAIEGARVRAVAEWSYESGTDRTDAAGAFRITRLAPQRYDVVVTTDHGAGGSDTSRLIGLGETVEGVVVKVFPAARVTGRVMITSMPPRVCLDADLSLFPTARHVRTETRTEDDGTIIADAVLPDTYDVRVHCAGAISRESYPQAVVATEDISDLVWEVDPGATIRGRVVDLRGQPIASASVRAMTHSPRAHGGSTRTTSDGTYVVTGLVPATYSVLVSTEPGATARGDVVVAPMATVTKNWELGDVATIAGTIIDTEGKPVAGAKVIARRLEDRVSTSRESDADGAFRLTVPAGEYRLLADRDDVTLEVVGPPSVVTASVGNTATAQLRVRLESGTIRGTVVDSSGAAISDAYVVAAFEDGGDLSVWTTRESYTRNRPVLAGADGAFALTGLRAGSYLLRAYRPGGGEVIAEHVPVGATRRLEIRSTGTLEGVAVIRGASPPLELTVAIEDRSTHLVRTENLLRTEGRFVVRDLPPGHYRVTVDSSSARGALEVDLIAGEHKRGLVVELTPLLTITGRIVDLVTGEPIAGVRMSASLMDGSYLDYKGGTFRGPHVSDARGHFAIQRVSRGRLYISGDKDADIGPLNFERTVSGSLDLGDIAVARPRAQEDRRGELGIYFAERKDGETDETYRYRITAVVPDSPAARARLLVGDVITAIDGVDVTGSHGIHVRTLLTAPVGTNVLLGLARGVSVPVILGPRLSP